MQKRNQTEFRVEKVIKKKVINCMLSDKVMTIRLIAGLKKYISQYEMKQNKSWIRFV